MEWTVLIVTIIIFVLLLCIKTTKDYLKSHHGELNTLIALGGIIVGALFANNIIVRIDNIDASINDFYAGYYEEKFDLKDDLSSSEFRNLSNGSQIVVRLKKTPIPLSLRLWFGTERGTDFLGPTYYKINGDEIKINLPNTKEIYLENPNLFVHLIYQEDKTSSK